MKKKILSFLLVLCMVLPFGITLSACGGAHECEAATEWVSDDTYHWKTCTTEGCEEKLEEAEIEKRFLNLTLRATIDEIEAYIKEHLD